MNVLHYLGLNSDYKPDPSTEPITFLNLHLHALPPNHLAFFSLITTPQQRAHIPTIRNRRLKYLDSNPPELSFDAARRSWPTIWPGRERVGQAQANEEKKWAQDSFLEGQTQHIGKLADLLSGYEEEREAERVRILRREHAEASFVPEEDESDSDDSDHAPEEPESEAEIKATFERTVRERFIYGLLSDIDYDKVDWNDRLDSDYDRETEEKWFDEEEED